MRTEKIYCPVNGWDCPYFVDGECAIEDPFDECDDFAIMWDEGDDYICHEEKRNAYEVWKNA